ncbi:MAG: lactate dehydrogenase [Acidobacteria bacterium]|nr:MAG: lactate dehydrogenase [Acidobacteriota bacterium]
MKVLISTVPFGSVPNHDPLGLLEAARVRYQLNPFGRRLTEPELVELIHDVSILIAGTEPITTEVMEAAPQLRLIARVGIGLDSVDLEAARMRGIAVTYTPEAPAPAVAELTVGLMLDLLRSISRADRLMHSKHWRRFLGRRLDGLTVGVLGVGRVGKRVIRILRGGFPNVRILANDIQPDFSFGEELGIEWVEKNKLYANSDIVTLHLPLTQITNRLITEREIGMMKPSAFIINTSRGGIVDESALATALTSGCLAGAAIDVFDREPYSGVLTDIEPCILTCHMGSMSEDCRAAMETEALEDVLRFVRGDPLKQPVPEVEYTVSKR